ncbi:hypothetical protein FX985_05947 [Pseudomonas extremaustralis]|uniref:Uncharacterized protein n=1 Tax=Pseudomonas extremaustralis TaxID=359110 RepID=A0A5M9IUL8_9PSED|nr:hypothetical protein FX985_05947 [Pseudomonas extremaustralis]
MNKRLIQASSVIGVHEALSISEAVETPLTQHVEVIAVGNDLIDVMR